MSRILLETLEPWLATATRGLCDEACARIRSEVQGHVFEAYESQIEAGSTPLAAVNATIVSLGDPNQANRKYEKVYLTRREEKVLAKVRNRPTNWPRGVLLGFAALMGLLPVLFNGLPLDRVLPSPYLIYAVYCTAVIVLIVRRLFGNNIKVVLLVDALCPFLVWTIAVPYLISAGGITWMVFCMIVTLGMGLSFPQYVRLIRKLDGAAYGRIPS
ncbi:MAG: hypothetical protein AMXMBFR84_41570 [Candidatus Hydrogenedentota bacterium]